MNVELLLKVADCIKTDWSFLCGFPFSGRWCNCEAETIAADTLILCAENYRKHCEAFRWADVYLAYKGGMYWDSSKGMKILMDDGAITMQPYKGKLKPDSRLTRLLQLLGLKEDTVQRDDQGNYLVIRPTEEMLEYAADKLLIN